MSAGAMEAAKLLDSVPSALRFSSRAFGVVDEVFEFGGGGGEYFKFSSFTRRSSAPFCL